MISATVKLKIGLIATLILMGVSLFATNSQLLAFYTVNISQDNLNIIADLQIAAFFLLIAIVYKLWKYHELCKECFVQKEMVKEREL